MNLQYFEYTIKWLVIRQPQTGLKARRECADRYSLNKRYFGLKNSNVRFGFFKARTLHKYFKKELEKAY